MNTSSSLNVIYNMIKLSVFDRKLIKLIDRIDNINLFFKERFKDSNFESDWKLISYVIKNHLNNKTISIKSIINYSNLAHATGLRKINNLIKNKKFYKKSKSKSGKSFSIHPSPKLIQDFEIFLNNVNQSLNSDSKIINYYTETTPHANLLASRYVLYPRIH